MMKICLPLFLVGPNNSHLTENMNSNGFYIGLRNVGFNTC